VNRYLFVCYPWNVLYRWRSLFLLLQTKRKCLNVHTISFKLLSFLKKNVILMTSSCILYVPPCQLLKKVTDFHENWYERYAIRDNPNVILLSFLQSLITITIETLYELHVFLCSPNIYRSKKCFKQKLEITKHNLCLKNLFSKSCDFRDN
jgi:hypothetical protein